MVVNLGPIRDRLAAARHDAHAGGVDDSAWDELYEHAPTDLDALVAEVEALRRVIGDAEGRLTAARADLPLATDIAECTGKRSCVGCRITRVHWSLGQVLDILKDGEW